MTARPTRDELRQSLMNAPEAANQETKRNDDAKRPAAVSGREGIQEASGGDGDASGPSRDRVEIFPNCPVQPLGVNGDFAYFLDAHGQLRAAKKLENQVIQSLFGHHMAKLCFNFPKWVQGEDGKPIRKPGEFNGTAASMKLWETAGQCGVFSPDGAVRGVGAWTDDDGDIIYHMGDEILYHGRRHKPGMIGDRVYPAAAPIPHPDTSDTAPDPAPDILATLRSWSWRDPDLHPHVALGMIAVQMICGALDWRPVFWLLAPAGAGKSEFQRMLSFLHGDAGLVQSTDATKSGITSQLKQSSLPVAVDELEPGDERSSKEKDIITLARVAASGGQWFRGSSDQTGVGGKVYSAFLFSSILIPGVMKTQDVQRLIRLEMMPLDKSAAKLSLRPRTWRARGQRLKSILIDRWHTFPDRLAVWRHALELAGVTGRDADNWSTVLCLSDMAQHADLPDQDAAEGLARKVAFLVTADKADTSNDAEAMLSWLLGSTIDPFRRGQQWTVAQWVMLAADLPGAPREIFPDLGDTPRDVSDRMKKANQMLSQFGLRVCDPGDDASLFIANSGSRAQKELFRGSDWAGGVWKQSAIRVPGAVKSKGTKTLAGVASRGIFMPLKSIPGLMAFPSDQTSATGRAADYGAEDFV